MLIFCGWLMGLILMETFGFYCMLKNNRILEKKNLNFLGVKCLIQLWFPDSSVILIKPEVANENRLTAYWHPAALFPCFLKPSVATYVTKRL